MISDTSLVWSLRKSEAIAAIPSFEIATSACGLLAMMLLW
jgi:hypothetical protein